MLPLNLSDQVLNLLALLVQKYKYSLTSTKVPIHIYISIHSPGILEESCIYKMLRDVWTSTGAFISNNDGKSNSDRRRTGREHERPIETFGNFILDMVRSHSGIHGPHEDRQRIKQSSGILDSGLEQIILNTCLQLL